MTTLLKSCGGLLAALLVAVLCVSANAQRMKRSYRSNLDLPREEALYMPSQKRPFCNAFTGCGRKRSVPVDIGDLLQRQRQDSRADDSTRHSARRIAEDDSIGTLLDLSSEPAVEDLSRQIMSEAKLWEAIQEASAEISRRRQSTRQQRYPVAFSAQ